MAKILDPRLRDHVLRDFFEITTLIFTPDMAQRLKTARKHLGLSQRQLADKLGLSQAIVCRLETGKTTIAPCNCARFKAALAEHFDYVLLERGFLHNVDVTEEYNKQTRRTVVKPKWVNKV